mmetsp:Transcript_9234/g.20098  ORF Transcript_9234/g.20098 Transcript_9234/m.20098 type:complete len:322 (+) Transcript_9234:221-1186(+)
MARAQISSEKRTGGGRGELIPRRTCASHSTMVTHRASPIQNTRFASPSVQYTVFTKCGAPTACAAYGCDFRPTATRGVAMAIFEDRPAHAPRRLLVASQTSGDACMMLAHAHRGTQSRESEPRRASRTLGAGSLTHRAHREEIHRTQRPHMGRRRPPAAPAAGAEMARVHIRSTHGETRTSYGYAHGACKGEWRGREWGSSAKPPRRAAYMTCTTLRVMRTMASLSSIPSASSMSLGSTGMPSRSLASAARSARLIVSPPRPRSLFLICSRSSEANLRDAAERPVVMISMSIVPVFGSIAAVCIESFIRRTASSTSDSSTF